MSFIDHSKIDTSISQRYMIINAYKYASRVLSEIFYLCTMHVNQPLSLILMEKKMQLDVGNEPTL